MRLVATALASPVLKPSTIDICEMKEWTNQSMLLSSQTSRDIRNSTLWENGFRFLRKWDREGNFEARYSLEDMPILHCLVKTNYNSNYNALLPTYKNCTHLLHSTYSTEPSHLCISFT